MKSSVKVLRCRGMVLEEDIAVLQERSDEELFDMIHSQSAVKRTGAIRLLENRYIHDSSFITEILEQLCIEKCLYTKLEICAALKKGDADTARQMVQYLGKIGRNQHHILPNSISKKISFPLPRDIIARSLGRMSKTVFSMMIEVLQIADREVISELLDAAGYMVFYSTELSTLDYARHIYKVINKWRDDDLVVWKAVMCLSAFPLVETIELLESIKAEYLGSLIYDEAERSLNMIRKQTL